MLYDCTSLECNNYDVAIGYDGCNYGDTHRDDWHEFCWELEVLMPTIEITQEVMSWT